MFGKTKETSATDEHTELDASTDDFFGDETAVAEAVRVDQLLGRVTQVEQQVSSQFTSLAAYAQISQEQIELVRSEAQHANERSEQRIVGLIERERADRMSTQPGGVDVTARLDALDAQMSEIRDGLRECLLNQEALVDAMAVLFGESDAAAPKLEVSEAQPELSMPAPAPVVETAPLAAAPSFPSPHDTPLPPPAHPFSIEELDHELEELGIELQSGTNTAPAIDSANTRIGLFSGPIDGLSLV